MRRLRRPLNSTSIYHASTNFYSIDNGDYVPRVTVDLSLAIEIYRSINHYPDRWGSWCTIEPINAKIFPIYALRIGSTDSVQRWFEREIAPRPILFLSLTYDHRIIVLRKVVNLMKSIFKLFVMWKVST